MLSIAWKDEDKAITKDHSIRGVTVGENDTTLNELWAASPRPRSGRI
jgi:hypothetical protein